MKPTADMQAILGVLQFPEVTGTVAEIAFCTQIAEWRVEIDVEDMANEGWVTLSIDCDDNTVAKLVTERSA